VKEDDEFVASEPQGEPVLTSAGCDYSGDLSQDGVAGEVAVDIVDEFEVVDIGEYRAPGLTRSGRGEGRGSGDQDRTGREPGQRIQQNSRILERQLQASGSGASRSGACQSSRSRTRTAE
jgi:hypothetical protein